ncbi:hypothetical protein [Synechococcus elongatus]|uniref:hypothetical protein n=1 Tax=Synechococcus elongatus TaxID=32046 RepID=UPI000F7E099B|nr:hypothetical protein [Synechococcus elongatus]
MRDFLKNVTDGLVPAVTANITAAAQAAIDGAATLLTPGAGVIRQDGAVSQNPQAFGFAFEHLQAIGYNLQASLQGSENRAWQVPADGTAAGADVYVTDAVGRTIVDIQAKVGSADYVARQVNSGRYASQTVVTDAANQGIDGASVVIEVDGIRSFPIDRGTAEWVAAHPFEAAALIELAAIGGEAVAGGVSGAAINGAIAALLEGIKVAGAYARGEGNPSEEQLKAFQQAVLQALQAGFIRGAAIKLLQRLLQGNGFAVLGFAIAAEAAPALIQVLRGELTLEQAIAQVGPRAFTAGMVTTVVLLFPPVGAALFSASVLKAVWEELTPEFRAYVLDGIEAAGRGAVAGVQVGQAHLKAQPWDLFGASSASALASSAEMQAMQSELDSLLE